VKYMPRTIVGPDDLLGEDPLSKFEDAIDVEMYIKNTQQFEGEGDFLSKFNLEIRDQITFVMARKRWEQVSNEKMLTEVGYNIQLEDASTTTWGNSIALRLENGGIEGYQTTSPRPFEGDFVFFPLNNKLYEIKFVEHENIFYQHGKLYTYELTCELVDRMGAVDLNTGNTAIDAIESRYSQDILIFQIQNQDGTNILAEDGGYMLQEYRVETQVVTANNELFTQKSIDYLDFSERNPFSEIDRF